jgi:Na+-translocating ferredoxin:NAD+ oxidoreductase RnfG subunit
MVLKLLLIVSSIGLLFNPNGRTLYDITKKRADKELSKYWQQEEYELAKIELSTPSEFELYNVRKGNSDHPEYVLFDEAPSKVDTFIYMVIFNKDGVIKKVSVLLYKENYGGEIASKRFLRQFEGKTNGQEMQYNQDIDGISGATLSVRSITHAVKKNSIAFSKIIKEL